MAKRFSFALNKLHLWNLTDYDRVVYLDADNIAVRHDMVEELFLCGHFCVVYMNPCHFHTGVIVVKPNRTMFHDLQASLQKTGSYDGADQGFLSEFFNKGCRGAPVFNARRGKSEASHNLLHITYNMHALYLFARGDLDVYRCGPAGAYPQDKMPVATLGFPVPPIIKPWYYWTPIMGHADEWHAVRNTLDEGEMAWLFFGQVLLALLAFSAASFTLAPYIRTDRSIPWLSRYLRRLGTQGAGLAVGVVACILTNRLCNLYVTHIMRPVYGLTLYCLCHMLLLTMIARVAANVCFAIVTTPAAPSPVSQRHMLHIAFALTAMCLSRYWRALFLEPILGYGILTVLLAFLISALAVVGTQLYLFIDISRHSPLFAHV